MAGRTNTSAGRPTIYTTELAARLCSKLSEGQSLRKACTEEDMPSTTQVFVWLHDKPEFAEQYARAKEESADAMAEYIIDIADDARNDFMEDDYNKGKTPGYQLNGENIQRSKLRVDTRKWLMAKMKPKKYGEKLDMTTNGKELPTPILGGVSKYVYKPEEQPNDSN